MMSVSEEGNAMAIDEDYRKAINEKIERAIAQIDRGEGISSDELPARLRERKAAWQAEQKAGTKFRTR
jgi:hypothetical protein